MCIYLKYHVSPCDRWWTLWIRTRLLDALNCSTSLNRSSPLWRITFTSAAAKPELSQSKCTLHRSWANENTASTWLQYIPAIKPKPRGDPKKKKDGHLKTENWIKTKTFCCQFHVGHASFYGWVVSFVFFHFFYYYWYAIQKHIMPVNKTGTDGISLDVVLGGCLNVDLWNQEFLWLLHALTPLWGRANDALDCIVKNSIAIFIALCMIFIV